MAEMGSNVIYTAVFGDTKKLYEPLIKVDGWRYIAFTDHKIKDSKWEIMNIPKVYNPHLTSRVYKILPHLHFENNFNIYVDGNLQIQGSPNDLLRHLNHETDIAFFKHPNRNCIYQEARACIELQKDSKDVIDRQIKRYRSHGLPELNGLIAGGVIVRRNTDSCINMMNRWFSEILHGSKRDQLSWNYIAWRFGINFSYINQNIRDNPFCKWKPNK